ncbi:MAG TPA: type II secretion system F family protein [Gemmatimonadaceae bacterium]|nr:type II secretion system F family protein [Gemmatimonadaceae bacterium]
MPLPLIALIALLVVAAGTAAFAVIRDRERRSLLERAGGASDTSPLLLKNAQQSLGGRIAAWLLERAPESWRSKKERVDKLVHAGYDHAAAPVIFVVVRLACLIGLPAIALLFVPRHNPLMFIASMALAVVIGGILPQAYVDRRAAMRQEKLRRAIPDSLDLLVVCVEAGVSLDAAIVRVAKEMQLLHADLSNELLIVHRRVNAGVPREQALHGLWERTGVEDLRGLAANMIQSERWGTSIATVLRVYAEALRRKRKQLAEKRAATAPLKMTIPLAAFIFPAIFVVLLGPAMIKIVGMFKNIAH